mgnify:CR=1 FL=1
MKQSEKIMLTMGAVAVGAVAGILLAPKSGKETRADIEQKLNESNIDTLGLKKTFKNITVKVLEYLKEMMIKPEVNSNSNNRLN